ncbi:hypothetical protein LGQ02_09455 [Bacillus shivajii]|uniref:hypothetical protein n=1 Tax=Bacillus shivajii TaxID=1983719 RepID=UPI001CFA53E5|nr:hypothetical protein [Bacillus shivajii]UCZ54947.1 hypothetical protein LGQ02_09455 [Bacillus shivajii]
MNCSYCDGKTNEMYKVNQLGKAFCGNDCYDEYMSECDEAPDDMNHPYIDDYELMRLNYIDWLENWEADLLAVRGIQVILKADEMLDTIDEVFEEYSDYYRAEGDDGIFAHEIYLYMLKFKELQKKIIEWRPKRQPPNQNVCAVCQSIFSVKVHSKSMKNDDALFCEKCKQAYYPGIFSEGELKREMEQYNNLKGLQAHSRKKDWPYFLRKIKRSCRYHDIPFPDWIDLNYEF